MSVPTLTILSNGKAIPPETDVMSVDVRREVNRVPWAALCFVDGDSALQKFAVSNSAVFQPGAEIEIKVRYEGESGGDKTIFKGLVLRHAVIADDTGSRLRVELKDKAYALTMGRKSRVFTKKKDSEVFSQLLSDGGLQAGKVEATDYPHEQIVQYGCSDWDFLLTRAELNGLVVSVVDGKVAVVAPKAGGSARQTLEFGVSDIYDFEIEIDGNRQFKEFEARGWDLKKMAKVEAKQPNKSPSGLGKKPHGPEVASAFGIRESALRHMVPVLPKELEAWAKGEAARGALSMIRGRIATPGTANLALLDTVEVKGIGDRFNGKALVTGIGHRIDGGRGWTTDVQFGLSSRRFSEETEVREAAAGGLLPAVRGLQIGIITRMHEDPEKLCRVKVKLPGLGADGEELWARMLFPEAGKGRGWVFMPEPGDEVLVGFLGDDPRQPIVLGSMFGPKNAMPEGLSTLADKNETKGIVTRGGTKMIFTDKDKDKALFSIETKAKNMIVLDDDAKKLELTDANGNKVTLDANGITLKTSKKVVIDAGGNVEIKGAKVDVK